mmetsp:Transcript_39265/g.62178  ORF Transcript_39265/g.62178 Transcript_39265/m.62178 type:complete len:209 (+) Transcript_39265:1427-2053(+)
MLGPSYGFVTSAPSSTNKSTSPGSFIATAWTIGFGTNGGPGSMIVSIHICASGSRVIMTRTWSRSTFLAVINSFRGLLPLSKPRSLASVPEVALVLPEVFMSSSTPSGPLLLAPLLDEIVTLAEPTFLDSSRGFDSSVQPSSFVASPSTVFDFPSDSSSNPNRFVSGTCSKTAARCSSSSLCAWCPCSTLRDALCCISVQRNLCSAFR